MKTLRVTEEDLAHIGRRLAEKMREYETASANRAEATELAALAYMTGAEMVLLWTGVRYQYDYDKSACACVSVTLDGTAYPVPGPEEDNEEEATEE